IGVEPSDLARVGNPGDLGDLHAVVEHRGGVVQEGVGVGVGVKEEAVLTRSRVTEIAYREPSVIDPEDLGEHKRGTGFVGVGGDGRVGNGRRGDGAPRRGRRNGVKTVNLAVIAEIEAHDQAVIIDSLSVDKVRGNTSGLIDRRESGARAARKYETGSIVSRGKLADDIALVIDAEGIDGTGWR